MPPVRRLSFTPYGLLALCALACGGAPPGASDASLARAKSVAAQGAASFERECASCHGSRGEGAARGPAIVGGGALPVYPRARTADNLTTDPNELQLRKATSLPGAPTRPPFHTAQDLYGYVSSKMPLGKPGVLRPEQYWAVVNFLLVAHGAPVPEGGVTAQNAGTVAVQPE